MLLRLAFLFVISTASGFQLPKLIVIPPKTNYYYFAATATDTYNLESDYSNECVLTNTAHYPIVGLAWGKSPGTNIITNYKIYWGPSTKIYTNSVSAGTNLTITISLVPPPKTNCVITLISGIANWAPISYTNSIAQLFYRSKATKVTEVKWNVRAQSSLSPAGPWATFTSWAAYNYYSTTPPSICLSIVKRIE